jgi:hypothetical protein
MVKKIIIFTTGLLVIYGFILTFIHPAWKPLRNMWQDNVVLGENYIYYSKEKKVVIVGSSLGSVIKNNYLPGNTFNLSLIGSSIFSGLEIIKKADTNPDVIVIEINHFERNADPELIDKMFSPYSYYSKKGFNVFREENNPYSLFIGPFISKSGKFIINRGKSSENESKAKPFNKEVYELVLDKAINEFDKVNDDSCLLNNIKLLKDYEKYFKKRNVRFVFFEIPMDKRVSNSRMLSQTKKILYTHFPPDSYLYIRDDNPESYLTSDGKHMNDSSSIKFARFLSAQFSLNRISPANSELRINSREVIQ